GPAPVIRVVVGVPVIITATIVVVAGDGLAPVAQQQATFVGQWRWWIVPAKRERIEQMATSYGHDSLAAEVEPSGTVPVLAAVRIEDVAVVVPSIHQLKAIVPATYEEDLAVEGDAAIAIHVRSNPPEIIGDTIYFADEP